MIASFTLSVSINEEILKGEKIEVTTNYKKNKSDKYFFETGFINLKENKFLAKDINVKMHKSLYGIRKMILELMLFLDMVINIIAFMIKEFLHHAKKLTNVLHGKLMLKRFNMIK